MSGPVDVLAVMDDRVQQGLARADHRRGKAEPLGVIELRQARAAVAELIEADQEAIDTLDSLIHAMELPMPDALHMKALRAALPRLLELKRAALARCRGEA